MEVEGLRRRARHDAVALSSDPLWVAGVALYWGEGSKTARRLSLTNADPKLLRLFQRWCGCFHNPSPAYSASLNLHADNDSDSTHRYWADELGLAPASFTKAYVKPDGTGHRKNPIEHGVCRLVLRQSADAWIATSEWIDWLADHVWCGGRNHH